MREGKRGREGPFKFFKYASERRAAIQNFEASERATRALAARSLAAHSPFSCITQKYLTSGKKELPKGVVGLAYQKEIMNNQFYVDFLMIL